jgi:TolA-binding protein
LRTEAEYVLALASQMDGKHADAIARLERLVGEKLSEEMMSAVRYALGISYRETGQASRAEEMLRGVAAGKLAGGGSAEAEYVLALADFDAGRRERSEAGFEKALGGGLAGDAAASAWGHLAVARLDRGDRKGAEEAFGRLEREWPGSAAFGWARLMFAEEALGVGELDRAIVLAEGLGTGATAEHVDRAKLVKAMARIRKGEWERAEEVLGSMEVGKLEGEMGKEARLARGMVRAGLGDAAGAIVEFDAVISAGGEGGSVTRAKLAKARVLSGTERRAEAIGIYEDVLTEMDRDGHRIASAEEVLLELARVSEESKQEERAVAAYERIVAIGGTSEGCGEARVFLGEWRYRAGELVKAREVLEPLVEAGSTWSGEAVEAGLYRLGRIAVEEKRWADAMGLFGRMVDEYGGGRLADDGRFWLGESRFQSGDAAGALGVYEGLKKSDDAVLKRLGVLRRGQCLAALGRWREALSVCDGVVASELDGGQRMELDLTRGRALQGLARFDEARGAFQAVIDGSPGSEAAARAQFSRGEAFFHEGKLDEAAREFQKVELLYRSALWQSSALLELGKVWERQMKWGDAVGAYEKVVREFGGEAARAEAEKRLAAARLKAGG